MVCTKLTTKQESNLLDLLIKKYNFYANGASRVIFIVTGEDLKSCDIDVPPYPNKSQEGYVVKVAIGIGGINQNYYEVNHFIDYGHILPLADIFYYGRYVEIMERVEVIPEALVYDEDYQDFCKYMMEATDYDNSTIDEMFNVIESLEEINGYTIDNAQIGFDCYGDIVAYDYGYDSSSDQDLVSDLSEYLYDCINEYLAGLKDIIDKEEEFFQQFEMDLIRRMERR